ncbi:DinB family protein [Flavobacterium sp. Fl-77]|uniref:DinB family protein n=1 Tax=Flavobacterium flavipigmentatum TaxID=2893884 RepID=A0AAJ2SGU5_9FLAO|nr:MULTISPECIES: DinB family protein [unclassified Flavobacterium]MDX6181965.1 DinB family protein [Flavobacterium sp. Fl-33]MDX6186980.1 DinB family protein [Flavobacterium sp. Fl-77]UFH37115.1 DinB family protein [Flavobacterium sp. F-70]
MLIETLKSLFDRDLNKLKSEIEAYQDESKIWAIDKNIANSAGNICLHLIGNINAYIGAEIGKTGYNRNRPLEFSSKDIPKSELIRKIEDTISVVNNALDSLTEADLAASYPQIVFEKEMTTGFFLVHLSTHLAYHLGQINYHRRLV